MTMKPRVLTKDEIETIGRDAMRAGHEPVWQLANEVMGIRNRVRGGEIVAESLVSAKDGRGRVRVSWHDEEAFLDLDIAIGLGQSIIEAACAAKIDALLVTVLGPEAIGPIMTAVRNARRPSDTPQ